MSTTKFKRPSHKNHTNHLFVGCSLRDLIKTPEESNALLKLISKHQLVQSPENTISFHDPSAEAPSKTNSAVDAVKSGASTSDGSSSSNTKSVASGSTSNKKKNGTAGHCYVSFQSAEDAARVRDALLKGDFFEEIGLPRGRKYYKLIVEFAEQVLPRDCHIPECISKTRDVIVPDLVILEDFITVEEEEILIKYIDSQNYNESINFRNNKSSDVVSVESSVSRRVQHYGYAFNYKTRSVDPTMKIGELPKEFVDIVISKIVSHKDLSSLYAVPDQITINEYLPGQGIASHVDTHSAFEDGILSLSLGAAVVMEFQKMHTDPPITKHVLLPRRSLVAMLGESRYAWTHGIAYRKTDHINGVVVSRERRLSLTIRIIRKRGPCDCPYPTCCDSQKTA